MRRALLVLAALAGAAALVAIFAAGGRVRPAASGDVGVLRAYGQTEHGPVLLRPGGRRELVRPQDIAFQLTGEGTGPRALRILLDDGTRRWVMHEEQVELPKDQWSLEYVMHLDDSVPAEVLVLVQVEAPHARAVESVLPIRLLPAHRE